MKRKLSFVVIVLLVSFLMPISSSAQERKSKDVSKLVKNAPRTQAFQFLSMGFGWKSVPYEFTSLKELDPMTLTNTEKELLNAFSDVAFCFKGDKVHCCYWVKDTEDKVGLVKFDGNILVPPLKGHILQGTHPDRVIVGEQTVSPNKWMDEYRNRVTTFSGLGLGHFAAVVDNIKDEKRLRRQYLQVNTMISCLV